MENINTTEPPRGEGGNPPNFYEISEQRRELRKALRELGAKGNPKVLEHYDEPMEKLNKSASGFKINDFADEDGKKLSGAKKFIKGQREEHIKKVLADGADIDYEAVLKETPEIREVQKSKEKIADLKDFRMMRMFEILNPEISTSTRKLNESVIKTVNKEIKEEEEKLEQTDMLVLRQSELVGYKENLAKEGHICITPNTEKYLDAIGERMLIGKPIFLHGPTGTGKTSLARYAAKHFTGKNPEMVFCNPQTKESNVWGKPGLRPAKGEAGRHGAMETVDIYGPLARAMAEGKPVIFDEFTALPKEQMIFIKGVFNAKIGDNINIVGNGVVRVKAGFQMIFTANLKSEKNPERQDLPPEIAREFEQNNLEIKYTEPDEAFDIMISRLLNRDGSLDMSFYDLNTTLPNLCKVMAEIQESYTNETDKEVARRAGAMDASGKTHSLKKFVMTQGSIEAILSSWLVERKTGKKNRSFSEFLDERFKTALTFKEYSKEDRILVAKILASKGFLLTLSAKDLDLPEDIFKLNTIKSMRGDDAVEDLKKESGDVRHLTLKEVADLDPFEKRADLLKNKAEALLGNESEEDEFLSKIKRQMQGLFKKEKNKVKTRIVAEYQFDENGQKKIEQISLDIETKLQSFISFYKSHNIDTPPNFEDSIREIWNTNYDEIQREIETHGFNEILIIPPTPNLSDLAGKMKMENGYYEWQNFTNNGSFAGVRSPNTDKPRIILVHNAQNLDDHPELKQTKNKTISNFNPDNLLSLEEYIIFQKKYYEEHQNQKHLDETTMTWTSSKSGALFAFSYWNPDARKLYLSAASSSGQHGRLGARSARCFA